MKLFINTLAFVDKYREPINQLKIVKDLVENGYKNIEIRRDFLSDYDQELKEIGEFCKENNVTVYYSIPDSLYKDYKLNREAVTKYFNEAKLLYSKTMKFSVGTYSGYNKGDHIYFKEILNSGIKLYVENDQTFENGRVHNIKKFLDESKANNNDIKATFDLGNWLWAGEEPEECAEILKEYVEYVHFKDVKIVNGRYKATTLGDGIINYRFFLELFKDKVIAIEYPCGKSPIEILNKEKAKCGF